MIKMEAVVSILYSVRVRDITTPTRILNTAIKNAMAELDASKVQMEVFVGEVEDNVGINYRDKYDCRMWLGCDCLKNA